MAHVSLKRVAEGMESRPSDTWTTIRRLARYLGPYKWEMAIGIFFVIVSSATFAVGPVLIGRAVDAAVAGDARALTITALGLALVYLAMFYARWEEIRRIGVAGQRALADVRKSIFVKVQDLSLSFFDRAESGDLMSRLVNDVDTLNQFLGQGSGQLIGNLVSLVAVIGVMLALDWRLALVTVAVIPVMWLTTWAFGLFARRAYRQTRETIGDVSAGLQEELTGIKVTQAFGRSDDNIAKFDERNAANRDANIQATAISSAFTPALDVLAAITTAVVAGFGGWLVVTGGVSIGVVVSFLAFSEGFFRLISQISSIYAQAQAALAGGERILMLLDMPVELTDAPDAQEMPAIQGRIRFEHVDFSYDADDGDGEGPQVLHDVGLDVQQGKTVALVGPTGAGKTTVVNLLTRFYDVTGGRVLVDDIDVRDVTRSSLRSQMGVVLQESFLFAGTIADNIRYGRLDATDEEVEAAAKLVNAHDFIVRQDDGYETELGERGGGLSQGQRQLIAFARAVVAEPRILVLDEATASVDTRTEVLIQKALATLLEGRTSVVIAHRLSTIREADEIIVMDEGRIVERGSHDELLAAEGLYSELYRRQFGGAA